MATIVDGKALAADVIENLSHRSNRLIQAGGPCPGLAVIRVGDFAPSIIYVKYKTEACRKLGYHSEVFQLGEATTEDELAETIQNLNHKADIHGILIQLPLPRHLDSIRACSMVDPAKDVDGLHPLNLGRLVTNTPNFYPCTPRGILEILRRLEVPIAGRRAVVVGRSQLVGKPISLMLLSQNATVTLCHSATRDLGHHTRQAEILVLAAGRAGLISGDMIGEGACVIDVGMNRQNDRLCGDVIFEEARERAGIITPVPGGVGPMTVAMLMANTFQAAQQQSGILID